jgi:hypothetical protein
VSKNSKKKKKEKTNNPMPEPWISMVPGETPWIWLALTIASKGG